jgi:hypothetical protein
MLKKEIKALPYRFSAVGVLTQLWLGKKKK